MLKLPDVTLVLVETRQHELAKLALEDCERLCQFADVLVMTDRPTMFMRSDRRVLTVPDWDHKLGWSRCFWYDVPLHVYTSHALCIQWDSWVVDTEMWTDEFLRYDYIGAPWWYKDGLNVGNGGFCLRSNRLMRFVRKHRAQFPCNTALDDDLYCRQYRPTIQEAGFEWAPEKLALKFSFECVRGHERNRHFGFHAAYNFDFGCQWDHERIMQRARLMVGSHYMTKSNPYIWDGFVKSNGWVVDRLRDEEGIEVGRQG